MSTDIAEIKKNTGFKCPEQDLTVQMVMRISRLIEDKSLIQFKRNKTQINLFGLQFAMGNYCDPQFHYYNPTPNSVIIVPVGLPGANLAASIAQDAVTNVPAMNIIRDINNNSKIAHGQLYARSLFKAHGDAEVKTNIQPHAVAIGETVGETVAQTGKINGNVTLTGFNLGQDGQQAGRQSMALKFDTFAVEEDSGKAIFGNVQNDNNSVNCKVIYDKINTTPEFKYKNFDFGFAATSSDVSLIQALSKTCVNPYDMTSKVIFVSYPETGKQTSTAFVDGNDAGTLGSKITKLAQNVLLLKVAHYAAQKYKPSTINVCLGFSTYHINLGISNRSGDAVAVTPNHLVQESEHLKFQYQLLQKLSKDNKIFEFDDLPLLNIFHNLGTK